MELKKVEPQKYALDLREKFMEQPNLWYLAISPKEKADELRDKVGGDYSKIWHVHCEVCWKTINMYTSEPCYKSDDNLTWICNECKKKLDENR